MQYRLIESFSNSTDPLFPLPATDNQIPVTRIPGKFEKDEKLRGTIPEFSEASENAKKEKVIPSWLKCTSRGKKITEEIGSIEKWGKIGLKFSDIIPDRRNKNSKLFIQYFREIKFHLEKGRLEKGLRTIHHDSSISYLILSYLRSKETRDSANWTEDRSNRHEIRQRKFTFEAYGGSRRREIHVTQENEVFPLARIFSLSFYDRIEQPCPTNIFYIVFEVIVARSDIDSRKTRDDEDILSLSKFANGIY